MASWSWAAADLPLAGWVSERSEHRLSSEKACKDVAISSFKAQDGEFANVTYGQIKDGIDKMYEDFRNRSTIAAT